jgi:hypothetical protein
MRLRTLVRPLDARGVGLDGGHEPVARPRRGLLGARDVERAAAGHQGEVAAEVATALVEAVGVQPEAEEDVLNDVLAPRRVAKDAVGVRVHPA